MLSTSHVTSTWAELVVLDGSVLFVDDSPRRVRAAAGERVPIIPGVSHHIEPACDAAFYVQFYERTPESPD